MRWQLLATGSDGGMVNTGGSTGAAGGSGGDAGQPAVFEDNGALSFARAWELSRFR